MMKKQSIIFCAALFASMGAAQSQEFDAPMSATVSDSGAITALRFLDNGQSLVKISGVSATTFNPNGCSKTDDGFRVLAGWNNQELLSVFAAGARPIRLIFGQQTVSAGCDGLGRPIAISFEAAF